MDGMFQESNTSFVYACGPPRACSDTPPASRAPPRLLRETSVQSPNAALAQNVQHDVVRGAKRRHVRGLYLTRLDDAERVQRHGYAAEDADAREENLAYPTCASPPRGASTTRSTSTPRRSAASRSVTRRSTPSPPARSAASERERLTRNQSASKQKIVRRHSAFTSVDASEFELERAHALHSRAFIDERAFVEGNARSSRIVSSRARRTRRRTLRRIQRHTSARRSRRDIVSRPAHAHTKLPKCPSMATSRLSTDTTHAETSENSESSRCGGAVAVRS